MKYTAFALLLLAASSCATLVPRSPIAVAVSPGSGRVLAETRYERAPLPGVDVRFQQGNVRVSRVTNELGICDAQLSPGEWSVTIELAGMVPARTVLTIAPGNDFSLRADLVVARVEALTIYEPVPPAGFGEFRMTQDEASKLPIW